MIEGLEDRCLLATSGGTDLWSQSDTFNQFSSHLGGLTVFGFGVTDNSADNPGGANVSAAPKFEGFTLSQSLQIGDEEAGVGLELNGTLSLKLGFNVGFYVNAGTASLLHDGSFSYNVLPPTSSGVPTTITTAINVADGTLFTQSPELSAYVDLVLDFSFVGDFEYGASVFTGGLQHNPININEDLTVPLVSVNRQKLNDDGTPMTNPDGSPVFDGNIDSLAFNLFKAGKDIDEQINKAREKAQQGVIDEAKATMEGDVATTPAEKTAAQADMTTAEGEVSSGKEEETSTDEESGSDFPQTFGELMTVGFGPADGGLLGLEATLSAGFAAGPVEVGKPIGNLKLTLPDIALSGTQDNTNTITASTDDFTPGSPQDLQRQLLSVSVDPIAITPLGALELGVPGIDTSGFLLSYNVTAAPQCRSNRVGHSGWDRNSGHVRVYRCDHRRTRDGDPDRKRRGAPPSSSVTFIPGQTLQIQPPANFTHLITITPSLQQNFTFHNTLGLDFEILGDFQALEGDIQILGQDLGPFGPVYEDGPNGAPRPAETLFVFLVVRCRSSGLCVAELQHQHPSSRPGGDAGQRAAAGDRLLDHQPDSAGKLYRDGDQQRSTRRDRRRAHRPVAFVNPIWLCGTRAPDVRGEPRRGSGGRRHHRRPAFGTIRKHHHRWSRQPEHRRNRHQLIQRFRRPARPGSLEQYSESFHAACRTDDLSRVHGDRSAKCHQPGE